MKRAIVFVCVFFLSRCVFANVGQDTCDHRDEIFQDTLNFQTIEREAKLIVWGTVRSVGPGSVEKSGPTSSIVEQITLEVREFVRGKNLAAPWMKGTKLNLKFLVSITSPGVDVGDEVLWFLSGISNIGFSSLLGPAANFVAGPRAGSSFMINDLDNECLWRGESIYGRYSSDKVSKLLHKRGFTNSWITQVMEAGDRRDPGPVSVDLLIALAKVGR
ncbi:MAG: hypothetical protein A3G02_00890 [Candidatus Yanofskybacteria bacterium RIFCSPLOWO2_12_FULL_44_13b]|uniref:Uncharacterized protein n=1 Tax=Candidatus Yanofskybacteria bacterium RIFCSPLOWO2_02_FULL_44_18 TaxID=1802705 RepID=A0A1F8H251_9BACT|nr:MAG: hypothetical protein A2657_02845 [Candidatus Yanofskybacteria bacterium RIFCSPHIGHO2_01_FULL_44_110b]OGN14120.1 MAG: hypothetical protein A3C01_00805 [Candidatus Yanofskybacteria bacterium RIFCSPHIGHO2_02_FULL_44_36b]OGN19276.1 MAG: hypothetical protein A3F50_03195 [Candidatus Yanofskybacteria bacterium RIFCSPHIGHO2_12_FULL_44_29b]OGN26314.1 MAG: hypothetical protein A3B12_02455 [Candidatus Yanofskybacteria bacterium RIFCSPLOWO2_01_FULL_44_88]OGN30986.1 MAG: hypothetical protein A3I96_0